jgi:hypothetical protein
LKKGQRKLAASGISFSFTDGDPVLVMAAHFLFVGAAEDANL